MHEKSGLKEVGRRSPGPWELRWVTEFTLLIAILAISVWLRFHGLATIPFEQDELYTLYDSLAFWKGGRGSGPGILGRPVYYLIESFLLSWTEPGPLVVRVPAALFGVGGVLATWQLGRSVGGPVTGLFGAVLVAVSPWHLYASQFGRYWTLVYLMSSLSALSLYYGIQIDSRRAYITTLAAAIVGLLTHPTFIFCFAGMAVGVHLAVVSGRLNVKLPTLRAMAYLWAPLILFFGGEYVLLHVISTGKSLNNLGTRGLTASLRLIPAMVQWVGPATVIAGAAGAAYLVFCGDGNRSRWAFMAVGGVLSTVGLLVAASFFTGVYADYGISFLPLLFVSIGAAVTLISETLTGVCRSGFLLGAAATLLGGVLPGTVSHMADGTRFDYRPALEHIRKEGVEELVVGWPSAVMGYYAPDLHHAQLQISEKYLDEKLEEQKGFWLITSVRRYGLIGDDGSVTRWIDSHCRRKLRTEKMRLDFRQYRVELHWCGTPQQAE